MAALMPGAREATSYSVFGGSVYGGGGSWYLSRKELEENSPCRLHGIDLNHENYLRKAYSTFLQGLGMNLKMPQVTIATAIVFCHRFFLRQSLAKYEWRMIATVCMFLAGKVEKTRRPLKDVILVSYKTIHKKDASALQKIHQKEAYEHLKERTLEGEMVVLATLGYDVDVTHPYEPLLEAIKKFKVDQNALAQVARNFVNDGLRTSLCLQFKPHHIAAGAIFLAAKFLKVKLQTDGDLHWWQELDVTPRQLEEVCNQMLDLYEQFRLPQSRANNEAGIDSKPLPQSQANNKAEEMALKLLPQSKANNKAEGMALKANNKAEGVASKPLPPRKRNWWTSNSNMRSGCELSLSASRQRVI